MQIQFYSVMEGGNAKEVPAELLTAWAQYLVISEEEAARILAVGSHADEWTAFSAGWEYANSFFESRQTATN